MILLFVWSTLSHTQFSRQFASVKFKLSSRKHIKKNPTNMPTSTVKRILQKLKSTTKRQTSSSKSSNSDQSKSSKKVINNCQAPSNSSVNNSRAMLSKSPRHYCDLNKLKWNIERVFSIKMLVCDLYFQNDTKFNPNSLCFIVISWNLLFWVYLPPIGESIKWASLLLP